MKTRIICMWLLAVQVAFAQEASEFIHVDQFGYLPNSQKVGVLSNPQVGYNSAKSYSAPDQIQVLQADNEAIVLSLTPLVWNKGATHEQSGDQGWWVDFSSLQEAGAYYLYDPVNEERSATFEIGEGVYAPVLQAAGRMFYYNRCNFPKEERFAGTWSDAQNFLNPLQDTNSRYIYDPDNASLEKDLSGGWFDAGDYNKYVTFTHSTLHNLLSAYEENPQAFPDSWNIPESGNGIPDLLDEIKWELDWLFKMTNEDGSVHIKMGSRNHSENTSSPPSINTDPRYYGPTCTSASLTVASVFSHAAKVFGSFSQFSDYANSLEERAIDCFSYAQPFVQNNLLETECDDGSIVAGDADQSVDFQIGSYVSAAIRLFELTAEDGYHNQVQNYLESLEPISTGFWGPYLMPLYDALMLYTQLPGADSQTSQQIFISFSQDVSNNFNGYYGFSETDLYRAPMPDWSYHWGSSQPKASYGLINGLALRMEARPEANPLFDQYMEECLHYFHGVNPQGVVYLSNMYELGAEKSINEIYHLWFGDGTEYDHALNSATGPPPGYVTGGPNADFSVDRLSPPYGQPRQKSYLDFNTSWPDNSWEISEPAIYYQAAYVRLLANKVGASQLTSSSAPITPPSFYLYPNPVEETVHLFSEERIQHIQIYSMEGRLISTFSQPGSQLDVASLPSGIYILQVNRSLFRKFVKK